MSDLVRGTLRRRAGATADDAPAAAPPAPGTSPRAPDAPRPGDVSRGPGAVRTAAAQVQAKAAGTVSSDTREAVIPGESKAPLAEQDGTGVVAADLVRLVGVARTRLREPSFPWDDLRRAVTRVVVSLETADDLFCRVADPATPLAREHLVAHHVRVAVLAVRVGAALGMDRARLLELGSAGCLIDVGLWPEAADGLPPADAFRAHSERSVAIVRRWAPSESIVEAIAQHHERGDGQGFPRGLAAASITETAVILGLVDHYATLIAPAPGEARLRPDEAIRAIVRAGARLFAPIVVRAFVAEISIFPPGTLVTLSTGDVGRVVAVHREHPLRPRVEVGSGTLELSRVPSLHITGTVSQGA